MLATGGSIMVAMHELTSRGVDPSLIRIISIVAAPPALKQLAENYPSLHIYTAMIDEEVNDRGFIVPGLGDVGDRSFGT
jgi:uracil phosphoribosyltransferase